MKNDEFGRRAEFGKNGRWMKLHCVIAAHLEFGEGGGCVCVGISLEDRVEV